MLALGGKRILPSLLFCLAIPHVGGYNTREIACKWRNIVGSIQEKMKKNKEKLVGLVTPVETPEQAALREACDVYVLQACEQIRQDMAQEKALNRVRYDLLNSSNSSEKEEVNPHYRVHWKVELDVNFKKKEKFFEFDLESNVIRFGFAIPAFYILEEMEKNLAKDGIYPVVEKEKRVGLFRKAVGTETVKVRLHRAEICNGLEAASRDYSAGFTTPHLDFETGSDFAYVLTENHQEGK